MRMTTLLAVLTIAAVGLAAGPAMAKGKGKAKKVSDAIPYTEAIKEQMEGLEWGMSHAKIQAMFEQQIRDKYKEKFAKAKEDAMKEDELRTQMLSEIAKMKKSYVEFKGERTGFEGHMVADEFTHNNGESMLIWDAGKYVEYLFFFNDKFWKRLRAFRKDQIAGGKITFADYLGTLENRFGVGKHIANDAGAVVEAKWQDDLSYAGAFDKSGFFGVFCLVFTEKKTQDNLANLRTNQGLYNGKVQDKTTDIVDSVTSGGLSDQHGSVVDSYTGRSLGNKGATVDSSHSVIGKGKGSAEDKASEDKGKTEEGKNKPADKPKDPEKSPVDDLF
ncbi:MAG: hypothetical protein PHU25_09745 [Deltaproteobacteria bacterium]|nr:hypothetical protein [Deltaproteobacteria bacterium]